ncbi:hypothetical protein E4U56_000737 [Claviceps arundinis]|uniref:Uncharacterized protein n=1 Tax=Claviceps arundinis TaxID=1623583 RepID=A0A9P7MRH0_9HYPO|nr:hypothetical protein E4U56_000737 [Claviceps arundinis]
MGKDSEKIPDLSRENNETWFVQAKLELVGKGIFYPCIQTETQFAWEQVAWNNERRTTYSRDQAKAISILGASLGTEDKVFLILHQDNAMDFWNALKGKYCCKVLVSRSYRDIGI